MSSQLCEQVLLGDQYRCLGVLQHESQALGWERRIKRHVSASCLENAQQADHHVQRPLHAQADQRLGFHSQLLQVVRQLIGPLVQISVGQLPILADHGDRLGSTLYLRLKQLVETRVCRILGGGDIPLNQQPVLRAFSVKSGRSAMR